MPQPLKPRSEADAPAERLRAYGDLMQETYAVLEQGEKRDALLRAAIMAGLPATGNRLRQPSPSRLHGLDQLRAYCVRHRLCCLPAHSYKGGLPYAALLAVRQLQAASGAALRGYLIMAPPRHFRQAGKAAPRLFVPAGNGMFYRVHGADLQPRPWRAVRYWPLRGPVHAAVAMLGAALMLAAWLALLAGAEGTEAEAPLRHAAFGAGAAVLVMAWGLGRHALRRSYSAQAWDRGPVSRGNRWPVAHWRFPPLFCTRRQSGTNA